MNKQEWLSSLGVTAVYHPDRIGYTLTKGDLSVYIDAFVLAKVFEPFDESSLMSILNVQPR